MNLCYRWRRRCPSARPCSPNSWPLLPWKKFHRIVVRHDGDRYVKLMTCAEQFRVMAFAQLTSRESLRNTEV